MVSVSDVLLTIFGYLLINLNISMYPVGDDDSGGLSLGFGGGGDASPSPSPVADISPPPPATQMSAIDLFTRIRTDKGMLINILAVAIALLIGVQALLGSRRRRLGSNTFVRHSLWTFYTISFPVISYTIGLVQAVGSRHGMPDSQLLWAVGLLLLLGSVNGMSAFSRRDIEQSKAMLAQHGFKTLLVLWLLYSRSDVSDGRWVLLAYFLLCWVYSVFRMAQRMKALRMASSAHGLVRSAMVVDDYMRDKKVKEHSPKNLSECKYLVSGEDEDSELPSKVGPPYLTKVGGKGKVVTVDMIWTHKGKLLRSEGRGSTSSSSSNKWDSACALKHTCLSFALFKLLKRRFCGDGLDIAEAGDQKTTEFVVEGLLGNDRDDYERAFHVVELELSFLYDFFYTKYPALYPGNRLLGVVRFFVLLGFVKVLLLDFMLIDSPDDYAANVDTFVFFNNVLIIVMILSIDILQHLATGYSNWAIVQFVCDYVVDTRQDDGRRRRRRQQRWWNWKRGLGIRRALIKLVVAWRWRKSAHCWNNKLGQYSLLKSFDYNPSKKNAMSWLSLRMMEPTGQGRQRLKPKSVPLTVEVRKAVLNCLKDTGGRPSVDHYLIKLKDATPCEDLQRHTRTVLVWHIATTMCEELDKRSKSEKEKDVNRLVATTLSGYCAYLLAFVPNMLPDNSYKATQILDAVVEEARSHPGLGGDTKKDMRKRCEIMYEKLGKEDSSRIVIIGTPPTTKRCWDSMTKLCSSSSQVKEDEQRSSPVEEQVKETQILILGARLGRQLVDKPEQWKQLATFWAELVLFLAPSKNADVHAEHLAMGGEFITHLWAMLTHAGILERHPLQASCHV